MGSEPEGADLLKTKDLLAFQVAGLVDRENESKNRTWAL